MSQIGRNIAIIPARAGSKGLLRKNLAELDGKPLICWTIEEALRCKFFDKIVLTSDSLGICKLIRENCPTLEIVERPNELGEDNIPLAPVIIHALNTIENRYMTTYQNIFTLQPTSPLRRWYHIEGAYKRFLTMKADSLISVTENLHSIWTSNGTGYAEPLVYSRVNRQESKPYYIGNGAIFVTKRNILLENQSRIGGNVSVYVMDEKSSVDIHTREDLELAQWYLKKNAKLTDTVGY